MRVIERIVEAPYKFLKRYFKRNLSESGFSADKRRFGWLIRQKRGDGREMVLFAVGLLHNLLQSGLGNFVPKVVNKDRNF